MEQSRSDRWWSGAAGLVVAATLVAHLRYLLLDPRPPRDLNLAYDHLPDVYRALQQLDLPQLASLVLLETTGWYDLLLALGMSLLGRGAWLYEAPGLLWVAVILLCTARLALRLFGAPAAAMACALAASGWGVVVMGRTGWIHIPELALVLLALVALVEDPGLGRWRTAVVLALAGAGAIALRPSGLVWVATLLPLLIRGCRPALRQRTVRRRLLLVGLVWGLALVPVAMELLPYLGQKVGVRAHKGHLLLGSRMLQQLSLNQGVAALLLCLVGLVILLRRPRRFPRGAGLALLSWIPLALALVLTFRAGLDNFPAVVVALSVLGAGGLARLPRLTWPLAFLAWLLGFVPQWLPESEALVSRLGWPPARQLLLDLPQGHYRPYRDPLPAQIVALLRASCPSTVAGLCVVEVDHGLFYPEPEEPGRLELFLLGLDHVRLLPVYVPDAVGAVETVRAFAHFSCRGIEAQWRQRRPGVEQAAHHELLRRGLQLAWFRDLPHGCSYGWSLPGGVLPAGASLPPGDPLPPPPPPAAADPLEGAYNGGGPGRRRAPSPR